MVADLISGLPGSHASWEATFSSSLCQCTNVHVLTGIIIK